MAQPTSFEPLTQREREILTLLNQGLSDREIADRLVIAHSTVKWYNRQIFNKLGVENRQQAVLHAASLGLLDQREDTETPSHSLPAQLTPFVGRIAELEDLSRLLNHPHTRLVTILAPGGMGKTRLALAAAENARTRYAGGISFAPLAPVISTDQLVPTVAHAVAFHFLPDSRTPKQQLLDFLRSKRLLIILDNFEHLLEGAALVTDILQAAPQVKIVTTSRERLNVEGETVYLLGGMPYPAQIGTAHLFDYGAIQLFVECARRANSRFEAVDEASLLRICQLVQGMPLALELAATWCAVLSPAEVAGEIMQSADFLRTTRRDIPERLRSVRAVFEMTWQRLTDEERQGFRRLSVFRGGFTRDAAQMITGTKLWTLAGLVDKALVWHKLETERYEIHELLRQYAAEQLEAMGETPDVQRAHADYFLSWLQHMALALRSAAQSRTFALIDYDLDNLRALLTWSLAGHVEYASTTVGLLEDYWFARGLQREAQNWLTHILSSQDSSRLAPATTGQLLLQLGFTLSLLGAYDEAVERYKESYAIYRALDDLHGIARSIGNLGEVDYRRGNFTEALSRTEESIELLRQLDAQRDIGLYLLTLGGVLAEAGRLNDAKEKATECLNVMQTLDEPLLVARALNNLAVVHDVLGDRTHAKELYQQSLNIRRNLDDRGGIAHILHNLATLGLEEGDSIQAKMWAQEAFMIYQDIDDRPSSSVTLYLLGDLALEAEDYVLANRYFKDSLQISEQIGNVSRAGLSLKGLGRVAHRTLDYKSAWNYYRASLSLLVQHRLDNYAAETLLQIAGLLQDEHRPAEALQLLLVVKRYKQDEHAVIQQVEQRIATIRSAMTADEFDKLAATASDLDFPSVALRILATE